MKRGSRSPPGDGPPGPAADNAATRRARLAQALRDNLRRRKAQSHRRSALAKREPEGR